MKRSATILTSVLLLGFFSSIAVAQEVSVDTSNQATEELSRPATGMVLVRHVIRLPSACEFEVGYGSIALQGCLDALPDERHETFELPLVVPVACYDADEEQWHGNDGCARMVTRLPEDARVIGDAGLALNELVPFICGIDDDQALGYTVHPSSEFAEVVVAPAEGVAFSRHDVAAPTLVDPDTVLEAMTATIERDTGLTLTGPLRLNQRVELDLDWDGQTDALYSIFAELEGDEPQIYGLVAVLSGSDGAYRPFRLTTDPNSDVTAVATSDLDGDGHLEVLLEIDHYEGHAFELVTLRDSELEVLGDWRCGL